MGVVVVLVLVFAACAAIVYWAFTVERRSTLASIEADRPMADQRGWTLHRDGTRGSTVRGVHRGRAFEARRRKGNKNAPAYTRITMPYRPMPDVPSLRWRTDGRGVDGDDPLVQHLRALRFTHVDAPKGDPPAVHARVRGNLSAVLLEQNLDAVAEIAAALETGRFGG
jgi:hypothetical protein